MSELKDYDIMDVEAMDDERLEKSESGIIQATRVYIKSEADKVIAEKDKEIQRLENLCESYRIDCDNLAIREANAYREIERDNKQIRHHKYKRCLAMAERCKYRMYYLAAVVEQEASKIIPLKAQIQWYQKRENRMDYWKNRWLELAEQFKDKEAK